MAGILACEKKKNVITLSFFFFFKDEIIDIQDVQIESDICYNVKKLLKFLLKDGKRNDKTALSL